MHGSKKLLRLKNHFERRRESNSCHLVETPASISRFIMKIDVCVTFLLDSGTGERHLFMYLGHETFHQFA